MLLDARRAPPDQTMECDVCIVGAGAAGITLARELSSSKIDVVLLESGGLRSEPQTEALYKGEVDDPAHHAPLDRYRTRRLGGTTTVWGGWCAPFDEIDFERRTHVAHSGWPIARTDLDPYYRRAHEYCELGSFLYDAKLAIPGEFRQTIPGLDSSEVSVADLWLISPRTNFGRKYLPDLRRSPSVRVVLHANAVELVADPPVRVDRVIAKTLAGKRLVVRAARVVLAAGGLEVPRLLLLSNGNHRQGIGNERDLVGRFYVSHLSGDVGRIALFPKQGEVVWNYELTRDGVYCKRRLAIRPQRQKGLRLLNFSAILDRPDISDPSHRSGLLSAAFLAQRFRAPEPSNASAHAGLHLRNIFADPGSFIRHSAAWARRSIRGGPPLPSVVVPSKEGGYSLHYDAEQVPNEDSRVLLGSSTDSLGQRRLRVQWRFSEQDVDSVVRSCELIGRSLKRSGVGKLLSSPEAIQERVLASANVGSHHLGTTRMSNDPSDGVVNSDCRVHGTVNLYVASSSVFPTASYARPTLTIVALAIRLADHLKGQLR